MVSKSLSIDKSKTMLMKYMRKLDKDKYLKEQSTIHKPIFKSVERSKDAASTANKLYKQENLEFTQLYTIMTMYNVSIAMAPEDSEELAVAYTNKSAVLLRMRKYQASISELDKAFKITKSISLKIKMLCRKVECLTALGSADNRSCLEKAKFFLTKSANSKDNLALIKLVQKAQLIVENNEFDIPKHDRRKLHALEMIDEAEKIDPPESIQMQYSEKYGRHLVAARDFEPGEILLVEKPYLNRLDTSKAHQYCDHCFHHLWTAVPCHQCSQRLYCSEECKNEEWEEYHDIECIALTNMIAEANKSTVLLRLHQKRAYIRQGWNKRMSFLMGFFFKALKEAGSIEQMVDDWKTSEQRKGQNSDGLANNTSYKDIFTLPIDFDQQELEQSVKDAVTALTGIAKYTKILGKNDDLTDIKNLMKDDTAILVGSLLLKFDLILTSGRPVVYLVDPNDERINPDIKSDTTMMKSQCNHCLPLKILHTSIGCIPNVNHVHTYNNKSLLCAIRPIKAGDQLIIYMSSKSIWGKSSRVERQLQHCAFYKSPCECVACTDWSEILDDGIKLMCVLRNETSSNSTWKLWERRNSIVFDCETNSNKQNFPDIKILSETIGLVRMAWNRLAMPSILIINSTQLLAEVLSAFYDQSEIYAKVPHLRRQIFGEIVDRPNFATRLFNEDLYADFDALKITH